MNDIKFEWDTKKAQINIEKHGISFNEASTVFADEDAILYQVLMNYYLYDCVKQQKKIQWVGMTD